MLNRCNTNFCSSEIQTGNLETQSEEIMVKMCVSLHFIAHCVYLLILFDIPNLFLQTNVTQNLFYD